MGLELLWVLLSNCGILTAIAIVVVIFGVCALLKRIQKDKDGDYRIKISFITIERKHHDK